MDTLDENALMTFAAFISFVMGGLIGSFLNVVVYRMPRGESVVSPRSRCPQCENPLAWYDNIPILGWLILHAKCRYCGQPISWQYPLVESITAVLFLLVFIKFEITLATPVYMLLCASLVVVTFVDLTDWTIPNEITFPGIPLGVVLSVVAMLYEDSGLQLNSPILSVAGLVVGGGILYMLDKAALMFLGKPGMGFGDVKLMAMLGAIFGLPGVILTIVLSSFIGSIAGVTMILLNKRKEGSGEEGNYLPFGPSIAVAGILVMFVGPELINAYMDFVRI